MILAFKIIIVLCTIFSISFVVIYSRVPWYTTPVGWLLMMDGIVISWILMIQILQIFSHHVPMWVQFVSTILLASILAWRAVLAIMAQRDGRKKIDHETR